MKNELLNSNIFAALKTRRSFYDISAQSTLSDDELVRLVENALILTPSAFNSQSPRAVLLLGKSHKKLWDITADTLKKIVPEKAFSKTAEKLNGFKGGYGTVLFFEDTAVTEGLQKQFPLYAENFPVWAQQANGMTQLTVWTAFTENKIGASLQHYNPLIDDAVKAEWGLPASYKLLAQMPFGKYNSQPDEKDFEPIENRFKFFK